MTEKWDEIPEVREVDMQALNDKQKKQIIKNNFPGKLLTSQKVISGLSYHAVPDVDAVMKEVYIPEDLANGVKDLILKDLKTFVKPTTSGIVDIDRAYRGELVVMSKQDANNLLQLIYDLFEMAGFPAIPIRVDEFMKERGLNNARQAE